MAKTHHKKRQITADLTEIRMQVQNEISHLRRTLNMKQHILESIKNHPWKWASCAGVFGWLLSGFPARKKRIYIDSSSQKSCRSASFGEKLGNLQTPDRHICR
jgi:hypothetical protein